MKSLSMLWIALLITCGNASAINITASSWLLADSNGKIIGGSNTSEVRSIASISKLITVMTVLDAGQDMNQKIGNYTRRELIQLALVKSDNQAAVTLCDNYPQGRSSCVSAMNNKVRSLGLTHTFLNEPTGLSIMNVSTAEELVPIVMEAQKYPAIVNASNTSNDKIKVKQKWYNFNNTNPIVNSYNFLVSKTGYIRASGGCIVMMLDTAFGRRIVVLLNSKNTKTRIPEAEFIANLRVL
jgi:D-alanyl-D-alanine carboxypeptidase